MTLLIGSYIWVMGLVFGSFALALVDRMRAGKDWVKSRSCCEYCGHILAPIDLVPLLSWAMQKGRCRYCDRKLSKSYPLVELFSGIVFVGSYIFFPMSFDSGGIFILALWLLAMVLCVSLIVFDLRWFLLPNKLVYPLIGIGVIHRIAFFYLDDRLFSLDVLISTSLALLIGAGLFYLLYYISRGKWIGDGDIRFGIAMGLFLAGPVEVWLAIFISSVTGLIFAIITPSKKNLMMLKIPYGPFLIFGMIISYLFSSGIIDWYTKTLLFY